MRPMHAAPRFLFVPVSGSGGAGEYHRTLAVARALEKRWPGCTIRFVLNRAAPYAAAPVYRTHLIDDSPTRATAAVNAFMRAERPDVVVFDSAGRVGQFRAARAQGARVVYVSSRPNTRRKGFRLRRLALLDQHWIVHPSFLGGGLTTFERCKLWVAGGPEIVRLGALHEPVNLAGTRQLQQRLGVVPGRYVLMCPGGGGSFGSGPDAAQVFFAAARELAARPDDVAIVAVLGARFCATIKAENLPSRLKILPSVPNGVLLGLVHDAAVAAVNGGSLLLQSLTQCVPLVAAPVAGDQLERVQQCAEDGYARSAALDGPALVKALAALLANPEACAALRARVSHLRLRNGVDTAMEAIERLLARAPLQTELQ